MRKLLAVVAGLIALIVIALLVIPGFLNVNQYHNRIQSELQGRLGRPVSFGNMHLRLLPPRLRVDNVSIGEDPRF